MKARTKPKTPADNGLGAWLASCSAVLERALAARLAACNAPAALLRAMRYAALGGGKRLRPALVFAAAGNQAAAARACACAVELAHCYSLAHDDLPCMDNDDMRRGKPSCHRAHGAGMALLAGNALQALAFEALACAKLPPAAALCLARALGGGGICGGQALDIAPAGKSPRALEKMCQLKTGALFACALQLGLLCRRVPPAAATRAQVAAFAREFGLLFQLANDIADLPQDKRAGRLSYATAHPQKARRRALLAATRAQAAAGSEFPRLRQIAQLVCPA